MKIGDLVSLSKERHFASEEDALYYRHGVIIMIKEYGSSGLWYEVQWSHDKLWHKAGDLELINGN
tara:strand:+ start:5450 stop:5644 length:195 start_codon:yes stop_codon:yes gene_type:complete